MEEKAQTPGIKKNLRINKSRIKKIHGDLKIRAHHSERNTEYQHDCKSEEGRVRGSSSKMKLKRGQPELRSRAG